MLLDIFTGFLGSLAASYFMFRTGVMKKIKISLFSEENEKINDSNTTVNKERYIDPELKYIGILEMPLFIDRLFKFDKNIIPSDVRSRRRYYVSFCSKHILSFVMVVFSPLILSIITYSLAVSIQDWMEVSKSVYIGAIPLYLYLSYFEYLSSFSSLIHYPLLFLSPLIYYRLVFLLINLITFAFFRIYDFFYEANFEDFLNVQKIITIMYFGIWVSLLMVPIS